MTVFYRLIVRITCLLLLTPPLFAAEKMLAPHPLTIEKETDNMVEAVKIFLTPRAVDGRVKIWVFFTDKDVFAADRFAAAAAGISLTDRAKSRRAKMGREQILFADLPVHKGYVEQIMALGDVELRRQSKWLNAASFKIPLELIDTINEKSFVARVRPVTAYHGERTTETAGDKSTLGRSLNAYSLNYGVSLNQLDQIKVPPLHDLGITGSGVLVGMLDTGFLKDHNAFAAAVAEGRLLAEHDFVFNDANTQNEAEDLSYQHNHGTYTWSALGGAFDGKLYGPAYGASFILAKTEDLRSETPIEEDNWLAAVEWADSLGAQVISSSLSYGYNDWYSYSDFDGQTAVVTIAANIATSLGIVVCNSMGNSGPNEGTLAAPADAFEILSVGAVGFSGDIASFSSHGPTFDGRIKPEVCARGVSTYCASGAGVSSYAYINGTSLSTPLVGGAAALLLSVRPSLTPQQVRLALMNTACQADSPDNTYGWGIIDAEAAINWGAHFYADISSGHVPLEVSFSDSSYIPLTNWTWSFGDGDSSTQQNPNHIYTVPGIYDVSLANTTDDWTITDSRPAYILALADTLIYISDTVFAGEQAVVEVYLANTQPLAVLEIPFDFSVGTDMTLDTFSVQDTRAADFFATQIALGENNDRLVIRLLPNSSPLPPGSGPVLKFFLSTDQTDRGLSTVIDTSTVDGFGLSLTVDENEIIYVPAVTSGEMAVHDAIRGDANGDGAINVGDPVFLINYTFKSGDAPDPFAAGDANDDDDVNIGDAVYLLNFIFKNGPPP